MTHDITAEFLGKLQRILEERVVHNYKPVSAGYWVLGAQGSTLRVAHEEGGEIIDEKKLDALAQYSAVNQGHLHPDIVKALVNAAAADSVVLKIFLERGLDKTLAAGLARRLGVTQEEAEHAVTAELGDMIVEYMQMEEKEIPQVTGVVSRKLPSVELVELMDKLCNLTGLDMALPMNTGAEAVETMAKLSLLYWHVSQLARKAVENDSTREEFLTDLSGALNPVIEQLFKGKDAFIEELEHKFSHASPQMLRAMGEIYDRIEKGKVTAVPDEAVVAGPGPFIVACSHAFHGRTKFAYNASDDDLAQWLFQSGAGAGVIRVPFNDADALEEVLKRHKGQIAGFLVEPVQGEGGINIPDTDYLSKVRKLCDQHGAMLMVDEIQTGFGRTGKLFAFEHYGIRPDMISLGKSLSGGLFGISAVVASGFLAALMSPGEHGTTFGGAKIAMKVALEAVDVTLREDLARQSAEKGVILRAKLQEVADAMPELIAEVRGIGLFVGVEFRTAVLEAHGITSKEICDRLFRGIGLSDETRASGFSGLLTSDAHGVIRITPPLNISERELGIMVDIFSEVMHTLYQERVLEQPVHKSAARGK